MRLPARFFQRRPDCHKGDFGHIFILAGSRRFTGAACLCAQAALRTGAGLVTIGVPESLHSVIATKLTEVMVLPLSETPEQSLSVRALHEIRYFLGKEADILLIGPGLSRQRETGRLVRSVLASSPVPTVADADALFALSGHLEILGRMRAACILTPHPGEMARLLGCGIERVQGFRKKIAKDFALRYNKTLVLKGRGTIVASQEGKVYVNPTGNPGMASAGSGDVLSGMVAAFLAQGFDTYDAGCAGVYLHGLAGDLAAQALTQPGLLASDIIAFLPRALKKCRSSSVGRAAVL